MKRTRSSRLGLTITDQQWEQLDREVEAELAGLTVDGAGDIIDREGFTELELERAAMRLLRAREVMTAHLVPGVRVTAGPTMTGTVRRAYFEGAVAVELDGHPGGLDRHNFAPESLRIVRSG